ncbi:MAG TPA: ATP-binding protein [Planctomycetota bacterium]|nr:ATP-binding protein [Planctomycetota bacterium]
MRVPACPEFLAPVRALLERSFEAWLGQALSREAADELLLAVQEAFTNVARHAYAGEGKPVEIALMLDRETGEAEVMVRDKGRPFDPASVPPPDFAHPRPGGYGLHIMRSFTDRCAFGREGTTNWVLLARRLRVRAREEAGARR